MKLKFFFFLFWKNIKIVCLIWIWKIKYAKALSNLEREFLMRCGAFKGRYGGEVWKQGDEKEWEIKDKKRKEKWEKNRE